VESSADEDVPSGQYLGFEASDRCKNCGYDFSLIEFQVGSRFTDLAAGSAGASDPTRSTAWDRFCTQLVTRRRRQTPCSTKGARSEHGEGCLFFAMSADDQPLVRLR
jgi:hypothetical protein